MDLREEIERDLSTEPVDRFAIEDALRAGRRTVVRRRALSALAATVASVAIATSLVVALDPGAAPSGDRVASRGADRCDLPSAGRTSAECEGYQLLQDDPVAYTSSGTLVIRDGWTYTARIMDPLVGVDAAAVEVTDGADTDWALLKEPGADGSLFAQHADPADLRGDLTFGAWVSYVASRWQGTPATLLVAYTRGGDLEALPGWAIRQQATGLTMPAGYRGPTGVDAVVQLDDDARTWYLVQRAGGMALAFPLFGRFGSVEDVLAHVSSPAYDPDRQCMLGEAQ
ncbi:hypothetical protein [Nocardioides exalbidus]|nr:hypothetical protein [Nocardioides exalbidus]